MAMLNSHLWKQLLQEDKCSCGFVDACFSSVCDYAHTSDLSAENMDIQKENKAEENSQHFIIKLYTLRNSYFLYSAQTRIEADKAQR